MKLFLIPILFFFVFIANAQSQFKSYDELPGIEKMYKPAFSNSFTGWKQNVLTNRAIRETTHAIQGNGMKTLEITAIDEGVILDQVILGIR